MPPKVKVAKEDIINASVEIVRNCGAEALNARTLANALNCSTQPIFSNFASMDDLHFAVIMKAAKLYQDCMDREMNAGVYPAYKASGMAYIRFAKEEKELFKLLFMRDRKANNDNIGDDMFDGMVGFVQDYTGLGQSDAALFHLELWAYVHGIATMFATGFLDLEWDLVSQMMTDAYLGLRKRYETEK